MSDRDNHAYNEWAAEHLLDRDDETAFRAARNHCGVTTDQMIAAWAAERAAVEERSELERVAQRAVVREWWHGYYRGAA
jgi:hypothetical protein